MQTKTGRNLSLILLAVVLLLLISSATVFAEGETLPEEPPAGEETPTEEIVSVEEIESVDGSLAEEEPPVEEPISEPEAVSDPSAESEPTTPAEDGAGEEAPPVEETVVEVNQDPEPVSADLVPATEPCNSSGSDDDDDFSGTDPYFTVGTQVYRWLPLGGDCSLYPGDICTVSAGDTPIQDAVDYIEINGTIPTDRKIYALSGTYNGGANINGANPNLGQLNGLIGVYDPDLESRPVINDNVVLYDLPGGFTLSGFTINGQVNISGTDGTVMLEDLKVTNTAGSGIYIHTNTNAHINMTDVTASGNFSYGASIDNNDSGIPYNITINNSYFDDNGTGVHTQGLSLYTAGKIFMDSVSASRNNGAGIVINSDFTSLLIRNAVLSKNDAVPDVPGSGYGLTVYTTVGGAVTLENIYAIDSNESTPAISINTAGNIIVKNAQVLNSNHHGMVLDNSHGTGSVKIYDSSFNNNGGHGLYIESKGAVYLSSISASDNDNIGVYIDNCQHTSICTGTGTITITSPKSAGIFGVNTFNNNGDEGLYVLSGKAISVTNIVADNNGLDGMNLNNDWGSGGVVLKKNITSNEIFTFYNSAVNNGAQGIRAYSNGTIRVEYLIASDNTYRGADLENHNSPSSPGIIVRECMFNNNDRDGMIVQSKGSISFINVFASSNDSGYYYGASLNTLGGTSGNVSIIGTKGYICQFNNNGNRGLYIEASGNITLKNVEVNDNGQGAYFYNNTATYPKKVTITNTTFNTSASGYGVEIYSKGNISLNTVSANDNDWGGAVLKNTDGLGSIIIKNSEFNQNAIGITWITLDIDTNRNVTLYAVSASENGYIGVDINNCQWDGLACQGKGIVKITSKKGTYNIFNDNGHIGVNIWANGNVILSNIIASGNSTGLQVDNNNIGATGNVTLSASSNMRNLFENNGSYGIRFLSNGAVTIKYTDAFNNGSSGAEIDNDTALSAKGVTIKESTFIKNGWTGLNVSSLGNIILQGVDCSDNSIFTGTLDIVTGDWRRDVLSATFEPDQWTFTADATHNSYSVTLSSEYFDAYLELYAADGELIDFDDNSGGGTDAAFSGSGLAAGEYIIIVTSTNGLGSGEYDLNLNGDADYTRSYFYGARLENYMGSGNIKISYSSKMGFGGKFWNNSGDGLYVNTKGSVNITRSHAFYNSPGGFNINNPDPTEKSVSISRSTAEGNASNGFYVYSYGNVIVNRVYSYNNNGTGLYIDNADSSVNRIVKVITGEFISNRGTAGLSVDSKGNITLSNIASDNPEAARGAYIDNRDGTGNVTLSGKGNLFNNHTDHGLYIRSHGNISLTNFNAINNGNCGVYATNAYSGFDPVNIKITNTNRNSFNYLIDNAANGLYATSYGTISVNKVFAENNHTAGIYLNNFSGPGLKKISISNSISSNTTGIGLHIDANGPVSISNTRLFENTGNGGTIYNHSGNDQDMIINSSTASENGGYGFYLRSAGFVSINKVSSAENGAAGVYVDNTYGDKGTTIVSGNFLRNQTRGVIVYTDGPVVLKTITSAYNDEEGIFIDGGISDIAVTLYKVNTIFNHLTGIILDGVSNVTINLSNSIGNGVSGNSAGLYVIGNGTTIVTINKSTFMGNYGSGVELNNTATPTITSSFIFGNDIDGTGDNDLWVY